MIIYYVAGTGPAFFISILYALLGNLKTALTNIINALIVSWKDVWWSSLMTLWHVSLLVPILFSHSFPFYVPDAVPGAGDRAVNDTDTDSPALLELKV